MKTLDWIIFIVPVVIIGLVAMRVNRYVKSVADFMSGSRLAGRYLICNATGEMGMAVISMVAVLEMMNKAGFTISWWQKVAAPVGLFMALLGYVRYRYRETRAMTMSQFFEIRYSKPFRIFAGILGFISGTLNYGIFPAVAARFFVYFCGFPDTLHWGGLTVPTYALIMLFYLSLSLFMVLSGGQLTIMVTDCLEGIVSMFFYFVVIVVLLFMFKWQQIFEAMAMAPAGQSMLNPFDTSQAKDFNIWYVLIGVFGSIYGYMSWQGGHAFNSCASSAHEAKMGGILGGWRNLGKGVFSTLLAVCAIAFMRHPDFANQAETAKSALAQIADAQVRNQMVSPIALAYLLPVGIKGIVCALFFFGLIACDGSYLHSWGSILIQDVVLPFRKKPFTPEQHLKLLRWAIFGVATFGFFFSLFYQQTDYILMFFALTGTIFLGGSGSALIGGLYWKKGTTQGAWVAMLTGSTLATGGMLIQQEMIWKARLAPFLHNCFPNWEYLSAHMDKFPINGQVIYFFGMCSSVCLYILVSLLTCKEDFNMDRMLHRGKYAVAADGTPLPSKPPERFSLQAFVGIDEHFTLGDKILSWSVFCWSMFWFGLFVIVTLWNLVKRWPESWWATYWHYEMVIIPLVLSFITTIWFAWGGVRDLRRLFVSLKTVKRNEKDDGSVVGHHNRDDE